MYDSLNVSVAPASTGLFEPGGKGPLMTMVEVTHRCDMDCPICYANAGSVRSDERKDMSLREFSQTLERIIATTGIAIPLQLSGGEPTLHPELPDMVSLARKKGFRNIEIVTNGRNLAQNPKLARELAWQGLKAVYLQFDGLTAETHAAIRGQDLRLVRTGAIQAAQDAGLCVTLAVTLARSVNEREIGAIVDFALQRLDTVRAISFQAATPFSGRFGLSETPKGYTLTELVDLISTHTGLPKRAFVSKGLGHPECNALCLAYPGESGLEPLFSKLTNAEMDAFLGGEKRDIMLDLFRGRAEFIRRRLTESRSGPRVLRLLTKLASGLGTDVLRRLRQPPLILFAKSFMTGPGLCDQRLRQCCYGLATPHGVWSFCAYNHIHRFADTATGAEPCAFNG